MNQPPAPAALQADYFDGLQALARPVRLTIEGGRLHIDGEDLLLQVPLRQMRWPERQRHGTRLAYLPGHGLLSCADGPAWDAWAAANGLGPSRLVRWTQSWRGVLLATAALLALLASLWRWGLPLAAGALLPLVPASLEAELGSSAMAHAEQEWFKPSRLPAERQAALRLQFEQAVARTRFQPPPPAWRLHFRATPERGLGANALALPGGDIIVTDALVALLADRPDLLMGVLGHELGHVQHRHGLRLLLQTGLLAGLSSLLIGDFSSLLAAAPVLLGQAAYSRDAEFEADRHAAALLRANGVSPRDFSLLFQRLQAQRGAAGGGPSLPIGLASHPPDAERVRRMVGDD